MTEQEWLVSSDPKAMLEYLRNLSDKILYPPSERKLRLFACACCRHARHLPMDERSRRAVEVAERLADGLATEAEVTISQNEVDQVFRDLGNPTKNWSVERQHWWLSRSTLLGSSRAATEAIRFELGGNREVQAGILREIFGNPFRQHESWFKTVTNPDGSYTINVPTIAPSILTWNNGTVLKLAQHIYDDRAFDEMPILADALEEAGCTVEAIVRHCRGQRPCWYCFDNQAINLAENEWCTFCGHERWLGGDFGCGPHVRGCWVLDLLLGMQ